MKRIFTFGLLIAIFLLSSRDVQGQVTITQVDFNTNPGTMYRYYEGFDEIPFDVLATGANHIWDFQQAGSLNGNLFSEIVQPPSLSPFPGTNFFLKKEMEFFPGFIDVQETHANLSPGSALFKAYRLYSDYNADTTVVRIDPGLPLIQFPASFLSSWDAYYSVQVNSTLGFSYIDSVHAHLTVDGYGQLLTPYGSYNCIRLLETGRYWDDSTSSWGPTDTSLVWLANNLPVAFMVTEYSTDMQTGAKSGNFRLFESMTAGVPDGVSSPVTHLYPNPAREKTTLSFFLDKTSTVSLRLLDPIGKMLWETDMGTLPPGNYQEEIPLYAAKPGLYVLVLAQDNQSTPLKLLLLE